MNYFDQEIPYEPKLLHFDAETRQTFTDVTGILVSEFDDIAIFTSITTAPHLAVADDRTEASIVYGDITFACVHMRDVQPAVVTAGYFLKYIDMGVLSTTGAWYASSGAPLVDAKTMTVIGMIYRFNGFIRSDDLVAVPASKIRLLLEKYGH